MDSSNSSKIINVKSNLINKTEISIKVSDNSIGIPSENLNKIFRYGFTTKQKGHGFGLHATALATNELGGEIHVKSDGDKKGATFILELPYKIPK